MDWPDPAQSKLRFFFPICTICFYLLAFATELVLLETRKGIQRSAIFGMVVSAPILHPSLFQPGIRGMVILLSAVPRCEFTDWVDMLVSI